MNDDVNACDYLRSMDTHCRGCEMKDMYERPRVSQWLFVLIRIGTRIVRRLTMWFQIQSQSRNLIWHEGTGWGRRIWGSRQYHAHFWSIWRWNIISKGSCLFLASVYMCGVLRSIAVVIYSLTFCDHNVWKNIFDLLQMWGRLRNLACSKQRFCKSTCHSNLEKTEWIL